MYFLGVLGRWILSEMCQWHSSTNNPYPFSLTQLSFVLHYHTLHCGSFCISIKLQGRQVLPWNRRFWAQDHLNLGLGLSMMQPVSGAGLLPAVTFVQKGKHPTKSQNHQTAECGSPPAQGPAQSRVSCSRNLSSQPVNPSREYHLFQCRTTRTV